MKSTPAVRQQLRRILHMGNLVLVAVIVVFVLSGSLLAQRQKAAPAKPALTQTYTCVPFEEVKEKDYDSLVKAYPFLKEGDDTTTSENEGADKDGASTDTSSEDFDQYGFVSFADFHQNGMPRLFFLYDQSPMNCGSHGCGFDIYMEKGDRVERVDSFLGFIGDVYASKDQSSLLLDYSNNHDVNGLVEWRLKKDRSEYDFRGKVRLTQKLTKCKQDPLPTWNPAAKSITTGANANSLSNSMSSIKQKLAAGIWRDENSLTKYDIDGTAISKFDSGSTAKGTWSINEDFLITVWVEVNGKPLKTPQKNTLQILELTREKFVSRGPDGKEWHAIRADLDSANLKRSTSNDLPFVGTKTFCGDFLGSTTTVTIRNDGFATVKSTMLSGGSGNFVTFSGKLDAKKMLKWNNKYSLAIRSGTDIGFFEYTEGLNPFESEKGVPCSEVFPPGMEDVQRLLTIPASEQSKEAPGKELTPDMLVANLYAQENQVFDSKARALRERYFEKKFAAFFLKLMIEAENDDSDEGFGVSLLGMFQDYEFRKFVIGKPVINDQKAEVTVSWENFGSKNSVVYSFVANESGWQISDIKFQGEKPWSTLYGTTQKRTTKRPRTIPAVKPAKRKP